MLAAASSRSGQLASQAQSVGQIFLLLCSVLPFVALPGRNFGLTYRRFIGDLAP